MGFTFKWRKKTNGKQLYIVTDEDECYEKSVVSQVRPPLRRCHGCIHWPQEMSITGR